MNTEKLVHQLFIGKVADILGIDKTTELLKEAKTAIEPLTEGQKLPISGVVGSEERTELVCPDCNSKEIRNTDYGKQCSKCLLFL
jgi:hypothetical protein